MADYTLNHWDFTVSKRLVKRIYAYEIIKKK